MSCPTIIDRLRKNQQEKGSRICVPDACSRVGFAFSTKERVDFTRRALAALDQHGGFDLIWLDGSDSVEARELPRACALQNARLVETHLDVRGGPDRAICFGLRRLLDLGYDFCGLIENDILLSPGWFPTLLELFHLAADEGLAVGAATVRNFASRVLDYRARYTINWNIGAGMILFSRSAAQIIVNEYPNLVATTRQLARFYAELCGVDLRGSWDLWAGRIDRRLSPDCGYDMALYRRGMACVGSIPSLAEDLEFTVDQRGTGYVRSSQTGAGMQYPPLARLRLFCMRLSTPIFWAAWGLLRGVPSLLWWLKSVTPEPPSQKASANGTSTTA